MDWWLRWGLDQFVRRGNLRVTAASGAIFTFGDGTGPPVAARFTNKTAQNPELLLGEAYMNGTLPIEQGTIANLFFDDGVLVLHTIGCSERHNVTNP